MSEALFNGLRMAAVSDQAIVLRVWEYSETSQIVALLTAAHGRVRLLGKGLRRSTRRQFAPGLDALERGEVAFRFAPGGSELGALTEWRQVEFHAALRERLEHLYAALYAVELTLALTEELDPHRRVFDALAVLLTDLNQREPAAGCLARVVVRFQAELLRATGYAPSLRACSVCGRPRRPGKPSWFSAAMGGTICADCQSAQPEKYALPAGLADADPRTAQPELWFPLLDYYLTYIAGRRIRSAARIHQVLAPRDGQSARSPVLPRAADI